jgi:hypothetical protein
MARTRRIRAAPTAAGALRVGEGSGAQATRARRADRRDRAVAGPGGQRRGVGEMMESVQHGGSR